MNRRNLCKALGSLPLIIPSLWNAQANAAPRCISEEKTAGAKNVILFIGDGMSLGQWQTGAIANKTPLQVERFRSIGLVRTNPLTEFNGDAPSHGTAIATGVNSHKGAVGVDADDRPVKSILRYAAERGIATGIVSANSLLDRKSVV